MATINKAQIVKESAELGATSQVNVNNILDVFFHTVREHLKSGDKVQIPGIITFEPVERAARVGRNPHTGETIQIPAKTAVKITPGKSFKDSVA